MNGMWWRRIVADVVEDRTEKRENVMWRRTDDGLVEVVCDYCGETLLRAVDEPGADGLLMDLVGRAEKDGELVRTGDTVICRRCCCGPAVMEGD
ncbi:MAG TPA: hypothetical protein ENI87_01815 [bacterium]|nr:hypothetical protein [bacterium]